MNRGFGPACLALLLAGTACESEVVSTSSGCVGCHRPPDGPGLEIPHASYALACTDCHGGDSTQTEKATAHVPRPSGFVSLRELAAGPLRDSDAEFLRFFAPTHPAIVTQSCGSASPQGTAGAGCHQSIIDTTNLSVHTTLTGIITTTRFANGSQPSRRPATSVLDVTNPSFQSSTAPAFTYANLAGLEIPTLSDKDPSDPRPFADHLMGKACMQCHIGVYGGGADPENVALFRGVGCAACHVTYRADGVSRSDNPLSEQDAPAHAEKHIVEAAPADSACESCHHRSYRTGLGFKGWREKGENDRGGETNEQRYFGRPPGSYITSMPPDIHQERGMRCADCHVGSDAHGDGHIHPNQGREVGVECEDCHGTFAEMASPGEDGVFRTRKESALRRVRLEGERRVLTGVDGNDRDIPQVVGLDGAARDAHGSDHGEMECYACHSGWMQNYFLVRRQLDLREDAPDPVTGNTSPGAVREATEIVTTGDLFLGINPQGKIGTFMAEHSVVDVIANCDPRTDTATCTEDPDGPKPGKLIIEDFIGESSEGRLGLRFMPAFQHTVRGADGVRACDTCHPKQDGSNLTAVRAVYGHGTGEHTLTVGGRTVDLTRMVDASGTSTVAIGHLLATPVPPDRVERALMQSAP